MKLLAAWWFQTLFIFHFMHGIIPLTNSYCSRWLKPPTSDWLEVAWITGGFWEPTKSWELYDLPKNIAKCSGVMNLYPPVNQHSYSWTIYRWFTMIDLWTWWFKPEGTWLFSGTLNWPFSGEAQVERLLKINHGFQEKLGNGDLVQSPTLGYIYIYYIYIYILYIYIYSYIIYIAFIYLFVYLQSVWVDRAVFLNKSMLYLLQDDICTHNMYG